MRDNRRDTAWTMIAAALLVIGGGFLVAAAFLEAETGPAIKAALGGLLVGLGGIAMLAISERDIRSRKAERIQKVGDVDRRTRRRKAREAGRLIASAHPNPPVEVAHHGDRYLVFLDTKTVLRTTRASGGSVLVDDLAMVEALVGKAQRRQQR